jgi:hypothetical protein
MSSFRQQDRPELRGPAGDLVYVRITVPHRLLEEALDLLARVSFPVNPEIRHTTHTSTVEFPAYDQNVDEIRALLKVGGLGNCGLEVKSALAAIQ